MSGKEHDRIVSRMVEAMGHATQSFGLGRVTGQIYAHLYLSKDPQTLDNLTAALGISKGSASMCVRQLEEWGAVEKIWIKGDRKDYYRATEAFGRALKNAFVDLAGKRMETSNAILDEIEKHISATEGEKGLSDEAKFIKHRIERIRSFQDKIRVIWSSAFVKAFLQ